nr:facilitated trehalose transporter Tret1-like [Halyomorpha halys]XP_014279627.1 facilitated trehalose transporter Tret1-like [Halyomorpha halys]
MNPEKEKLAKQKPNTNAFIFQLFVGFSVSMSAMAAGAWLAGPSAQIKSLLKGTHCCTASRSEISWLVALMDLGNILTPIPASFLMNIFGRKIVLYIAAATFFGASAFAFSANAVWFLYVARLLAGMGKGMAFAVVPIYIAEVANVQIRGALSTIFIGSLNTGVIFIYIIAALIEDDYVPVNIGTLVLPIIFIITFIFVPESFYYLTLKEKKEKSINSLRIYRKRAKDDPSIQAEQELVENTVKKDMENRARFFDIFTTKAMRRATMIISVLALFQRSSGISPTLAFSTITLPETGGGLSRETYMVIFAILLVIANYLVSPLVDTWGRRNLLLVSTASTSLVQLIAGIFYFLQHDEYDVSSWNWLPYCCMLIFACTYSFGIGFIPSTLVGELFPTNVKCYASSVSAIILAATSFVMNRVFREVADNWGVGYMYMFFSATSAGCTFFVFWYVFETMGKTFGEIQHTLRQSLTTRPSLLGTI